MSIQARTPAKNIQSEVERIFTLQQHHQFQVARTSAKERCAKLQKLHDAIFRYRQAFHEAMWKDFRKPATEVDLTELYTVTSEIKHVQKFLKSWMRPQVVHNTMASIGTRAYIHYEPKGVVLIIAPWNYPINLILSPLITAIAAGNCAMLKPSEHTPHTSAVLQQMIAELFEEQEVALVQGEVETAEALLKIPFNHIFFTGAPAIGKIVMAAAAKNLTSVTLELGGKSPVIIDQTADIAKAAQRLTWSKFLNAGQTCIAPDYLWVHESKADTFLEAMKKEVETFYGSDIKSTDDYARMVNKKHYKRVKGYYEDALQKGAKTEVGGQFDDAQEYIAPTVVTNVNPDSELMENEIFGPILPVYTYSDLEEPLRMINSKEKALALYVFSNNKKNINRIINETRAGTSCVNHAAVQFGHHNLPFGGSNNSGIGKSHGIFGFQEFSNARAVFDQRLPFSMTDFLKAPYTGFKQKLVDLALKWF